MSGADPGTGQRELPTAMGAEPSAEHRDERSAPSFSYFTVTFHYPNEVSPATGTENINPGQPQRLLTTR